MSKNKSFFQKLSDSFSSIFPFNSTTREDISNVSFDRNLSPITSSNRRLASEAFGRDDDELRIKRARLHYDLKSLPTSRIVKPITTHLPDRYNAYNNNFNDTASDFSDTSNVSVSTSGVSSLHPRSSKRFNLGLVEDMQIQNNYKYPRNLNVSQKPNSSVSHMAIRHSKDFISSPAKKILEKLDKLTTPITEADKLASLLVRVKAPINNVDRLKASNPYSRPTPPIGRKKPIPIKAVTVSATSKDLCQSNCGPIRSKKRIGFSDDVDLDSESICGDYKYPVLNDSAKISFSNIPMLKKSVSTNTDDTYLVNNDEELSDLEFSFRPPQTINDDDYLHNLQKEVNSYEFKSKISENEMNNYHQKRFGSKNINSKVSWKCSTCSSENSNDSLECKNCENISNRNVVLISENAIPTSFDKSNLLRTLLENETTSAEITLSNESRNIVSTAGFDLTQTPASLINTDLKLSNFNTSPAIMNNDQKVKNSSGISSFGFSSTVSPSAATFGQLPVTTSKTESITLSISNTISFGHSEISKTFSTVSNTTMSTPVVFSTGTTSNVTISSAPVSTSSKMFAFNQTSTASISILGSISSSEGNSTSLVSTSNSFAFGQKSSTGNLPFGSLLNAGTVSKSFESSKPSFGNLSSIGTVSTSFETSKPSFGNLSSIGTVSTSFDTSKPSFGNLSSIGNVSTSFDTSKPSFGNLSSIGTVSTSFETSKPSSFGNITTTEKFSPSTTFETSKPFSLNQRPNAETPKPFAFGQVPTTSVETPKPFAFGQVPTTSVETPKPFAFGQVPATVVETSINSTTDSKSFSFASKTSSDTPFSFATGNSKSFSTNLEASKQATFGQISQASESKPFALGQISSTTATSSSNLFTNSKPFSFDQRSNSESQKPHVFGLQQTPAVTEASASKLYPSVSATSSIFGAPTATEKPFSFGNPIAASEKFDLFGVSNSGSSKSSSGFVFGQQASNGAGSFPFNNPLPKSDSSSSLFGDNQKSTPLAATQSLFGNNNGTNNGTSNLFAAQQISLNPSIANDSLKSRNSFMFTSQNASVATASVANSIGTGFMFNNPMTTSVQSTMNFGQSASIAPPFPPANNITSQSNMFSAVTPHSSPFAFGASSSNPSNVIQTGSGNMFGGNPTGTQPAAAPTFGNQSVFQFGGNVNAPAQPNNARRVLKSRRNRK